MLQVIELNVVLQEWSFDFDRAPWQFVVIRSVYAHQENMRVVADVLADAITRRFDLLEGLRRNHNCKQLKV